MAIRSLGRWVFCQMTARACVQLLRLHLHELLLRLHLPVLVTGDSSWAAARPASLPRASPASPPWFFVGACASSAPCDPGIASVGMQRPILSVGLGAEYTCPGADTGHGHCGAFPCPRGRCPGYRAGLLESMVLWRCWVCWIQWHLWCCSPARQHAICGAAQVDGMLDPVASVVLLSTWGSWLGRVMSWKDPLTYVE